VPSAPLDQSVEPFGLVCRDKVPGVKGPVGRGVVERGVGAGAGGSVSGGIGRLDEGVGGGVL